MSAHRTAPHIEHAARRVLHRAQRRHREHPLPIEVVRRLRVPTMRPSLRVMLATFGLLFAGGATAAFLADLPGMAVIVATAAVGCGILALDGRRRSISDLFEGLNVEAIINAWLR